MQKIEESIELTAPISRVWQALANHEEFGEWFRVKIEAPFQVGKASKGHITYPGYEHLQWEVVVQKMETEKLFSFTWHPYAIDPEKDYSQEAPTLVEFKLEAKGKHSLLSLRESGFEKIPEARREEAFKMNAGGWAEQMKNIENYLKQSFKLNA